MAGSMAGALTTILGVLKYVAGILIATPREERKESVVKLDSALKTASEKNDTGDLEKWIGKKL